MKSLTIAFAIGYIGLLASNLYAISRIEDPIARRRSKAALSIAVLVVSTLSIVYNLMLD